MTTITSAQANKLMQAALFTEANRAYSFVNVLTDTQAAPTQVETNGAMRKETSAPGAPVVRITDLNSNKGDEVDMQIVHDLHKRPTMGDKKIEGRGEDMSFGSFKLKINQGRHIVDAGGKMSQQRYKHDLKRTAKALLGPYFNRLQDQIATVHLAGARGDFYSPDDTIVPLASHGEFAEIMVNEVLPPSYSRHFFSGDATSVENIDSSDLFTLESIDDIALFLQEMSHPLQPIKMTGDVMMNDSPYYVLYVTPRQWNDFYTSTSGKDWQNIMTQAIQRSKGFDHPLFKGEMAMWRNILVRTYAGMPIRFNQGSTVTVSNQDGSTRQVTAGTTIDRAILVGGQALASAYGNNGMGGFFGYHEELTDHDNSTEISIRWINGLKKIQFSQPNGTTVDHGVMVIDSAVSTTRLSAAN